MKIERTLPLQAKHYEIVWVEEQQPLLFLPFTVTTADKPTQHKRAHTYTNTTEGPKTKIKTPFYFVSKSRNGFDPLF
jgi:hypothetical protein